MKIPILPVLLILLTSCVEGLDSNLPPPAVELLESNSLARENLNAMTSTTSSIHFETSEWEEVFKNAKKERKPIFIYGYAAWCNPCRYVNSTLLIDSTVVSYFNSNFMNMSFEMETIYFQQVSDAWDILLEYNIQLEAYPMYLFFNSKGELVSQLQGVPNASALINEAQRALDNTKKK